MRVAGPRRVGRPPFPPRVKQGGLRRAYAIYQVLCTLEQRQEIGHRYTVFVDSTAAIDRVRSDTTGSGQRFAIAAMEVCSRIVIRDNEVTIRWVPAHHRITGNGKVDEYAKAAARRETPCSDDVMDEYRWETSLSHTYYHGGH